jgi:glycerate 2-kinase
MRIDDHLARKILREVFDIAVASANPHRVLSAHLPEKPKGRCIVVGAGKASAAMAAALEQAWPDIAMSGVVVTRYGHAVKTKSIRIIEASHPIPDDNSVLAAREILKAVQGLSKDDVVIVLMSGGGSALMVMPRPGITFEDKKAINQALLKSGANIAEMNTVRKHVSAIKGGKLAAAAAPAQVVTLVISDVPGDDPSTISSGPTVSDGSSAADALKILTRHNIEASTSVYDLLKNAPQTPKIKSDVRMIASPLMALTAAANHATHLGLTPLILGDALEGEARELGKALAAMAISAQQNGFPAKAPCILLSGGETTVTVGNTAPGRGGRNMELLLSAAIQLQGANGIWGLACDTDGIDGTDDAAGAIISPHTLQHNPLNARDYLRCHDSYSYFKAANDLITTGPTLTNVNDFRAFLVMPKT